MMLGVPLGLVAGLAIAMLLNLEVRGMRVYRTIFYLPAIVPVAGSCGEVPETKIRPAAWTAWL